jgi:type IV pilus assembly protein PilO
MQVGLLVLIAVLPLAYYLLEVEMPRRSAIEKEREALDDLERLTKECEAVHGQPDKFEQELQQLHAESQTLLRILPATAQAFSLLEREVRDAALERDLEIISLRSQAAESCGPSTALSSRVELTGTYHDLMSFLLALRSHQRLTAYSDFDLERTAEDTYHLDLEFRRFALPVGSAL